MLLRKIAASPKIFYSKKLLSSVRLMSVKSTFLKIDEHGEPHKVLKKCEVQLDSPADDEVLVKMLVAPINPAIINIIQGIA